MKKFMSVAILLSLTACGLPAAVAIPAGLIAGPTVDRVANVAIGGTPGYTISADVGKARNEGRKDSAAACAVYSMTLGWYDAFAFSPESHAVFNERNADHCEKWRLVDSGELEKLKKPLPTPKAPVGAKNGLRIVR